MMIFLMFFGLCIMFSSFMVPNTLCSNINWHVCNTLQILGAIIILIGALYDY